MSKKRISFLVGVFVIGLLFLGLTSIKVYSDYKKYSNYVEESGVVTSIIDDYTVVRVINPNSLSDEESSENSEYNIPKTPFHKVGKEVTFYVEVDDCYYGSCDVINSKIPIILKDFIYVLISYLLINYSAIYLIKGFEGKLNEQNELLEKLDKKVQSFNKKNDNNKKK